MDSIDLRLMSTPGRLLFHVVSFEPALRVTPDSRRFCTDSADSATSTSPHASASMSKSFSQSSMQVFQWFRLGITHGEDVKRFDVDSLQRGGRRCGA